MVQEDQIVLDYDLLWAELEDGSVIPVEECRFCYATVQYQDQAHRCSEFPEDNRSSFDLDQIRAKLVRVYVRE
jgi:hypothetical protein